MSRKKDLAAYLKIHKRWVLAVLILLITGVVLWYRSDTDNGVTEARSGIRIDKNNGSPKSYNNTDKKDINRNSIARDKDSGEKIPTSKIR